MLMESMSVNHITSSPHYLQSNGLAEKFVGIIKDLFHKAKEEGQSPYTALMVYRNMPLNGSLQSPMHILQDRQVCTDLPLLYATNIKLGINHTPRLTAEKLCVKDKSLSAPTHDIPTGQHVMYREPNTQNSVKCVWLITRDLNMLLKHQIDLIFNSFKVQTYAVSHPTIFKNAVCFPASTAEKKHFFVQV